MSALPVPHPLAALRQPRFLLTSWPWRSLAYLLSTPALTLVLLPAACVLGLPWLLLLIWFHEGRPGPSVMALVALVTGVGLVGVLGPLVALPTAVAERWRLRLVDARPAHSGHRRLDQPGLWAWLRTRYAEPATWYEFGYAVLLVTVAPVLAGVFGLLLVTVAVLLFSPLLVGLAGGPVSLGTNEVTTVAGTVPYVLGGVVALPLLAYLVAVLAGAHAVVARALLTGGGDAGLRHQLVEVTRSRARLVDGFEAERRRIERDLHDGAQQRLVGLTLQLGLAKLDLPPDTAAGQSVARAHDQAKQLMVELRELIRGIYPKELADLGLPAAVRAVAAALPIPVSIRAELPKRPPQPLEEAAYFVVAEALTNVVKHSGASRAEVSVRHTGDLLSVEVSDSGAGGADPARGTGLTGLADRVATHAGRMFLASPPGGPTVVRAEFPCPPLPAE